MEEPNRMYAPGCYGGPLTYDDTTQECVACSYKDSCSVESARRLALFRKELGVDEVIKKRAAGRSSPRPAPPRPSTAVGSALPPAIKIETTKTELPVKVRTLIDRLARRGIDIAKGLRNGINPITDSPAFLKLACDRLLAGGFNRQELRASFITAFSWSYGTANAHVGQIFSLLPAIGIAEEKLERLELRVNA